MEIVLRSGGRQDNSLVHSDTVCGRVASEWRVRERESPAWQLNWPANQRAVYCAAAADQRRMFRTSRFVIDAFHYGHRNERRHQDGCHIATRVTGACNVRSADKSPPLRSNSRWPIAISEDTWYSDALSNNLITEALRCGMRGQRISRFYLPH